MSDPVLPNEPAARAPTGELLNQDPTLLPNPPAEPTTTPTAPTEPKPTEPKAPTDPAGAPEAYTEFKLPEGVTLDGETLTKAQELFKGLNLPQDAAQSLVDFHAAQLKASAEAPMAAYKTMTEGWKAAYKADPDIGPKAEAIKANIGKGFAGMIAAAGESAPKVAAEVAEFKAAMDLTGVGDHPAFIKVLNRFAERFVEPAHVSGGGPAPVAAPGSGPISPAKALYPGLA